MIKFSDLIINKPEAILVLNKVVAKDVYYKKDPRYVIGVDPFDFEERGMNVFKIYDKLNMSYCLRVRTKRSFEETVEKMMHTFYKNDVIISKKFIDETTGNPINYAIGIK